MSKGDRASAVVDPIDRGHIVVPCDAIETALDRVTAPREPYRIGRRSGPPIRDAVTGLDPRPHPPLDHNGVGRQGNDARAAASLDVRSVVDRLEDDAVEHGRR